MTTAPLTVPAARDRPPARLTPERVRQIEVAALAQLRRVPAVASLREAA